MTDDTWIDVAVFDPKSDELTWIVSPSTLWPGEQLQRNKNLTFNKNTLFWKENKTTFMHPSIHSLKTDIQEEERPTDGQIYICSKYFYWVRLNVKLVWFVIETIKVKSENYVFPPK